MDWVNQKLAKGNDVSPKKQQKNDMVYGENPQNCNVTMQENQGHRRCRDQKNDRISR